MSRCIARILVLSVLLLGATGVWAFDPASVYPENGFLFVRVFVKDLLPTGDNWSKDMPEFGRVFDKTTKLLTDKVGFHPMRDIHEVGLFITSEIDFQKRKPNQIAVFVRGAFQPDRLLALLPDLLSGMGPKAQLISIKDVQGRKVVSGPEFQAFFFDNETLLAGTPDVIEAVMAGKLALGKAPDALKNTLTSSRFFLSADAKTLKEKSPKVKRDLERVPPPMRVHLENLLQLVLAYADGRVAVKADFSQAESAAFIASSLDAIKNQGLLECESRLKTLEANLEQMSATELLGEKRSQMLALAAGKDVIANLTSKASGNTFEASFLIPEPVRSLGANPAMVPLIGILSAVAIPNFKRAREKALTTACFANQRILLGALEMYNMDHQDMKTSITDADGAEGSELIKGKYLPSPIKKSDPECEYSSEGDLSAGGKIRCRKHGSLF
ncbi:MAG TPA: hypothetical protein PKO06_09820 [Candidatus Ozemobacteraceae bacterium]|nr:hypothetical protein [Candidatus Ozemobacteraceae bacterium]